MKTKMKFGRESYMILLTVVSLYDIQREVLGCTEDYPTALRVLPEFASDYMEQDTKHKLKIIPSEDNDMIVLSSECNLIIYKVYFEIQSAPEVYY